MPDDETIAPEENCPPVRVRVWFRVSVRIRVEWKIISLGGNYPRTVSWTFLEAAIRRCSSKQVL